MMIQVDRDRLERYVTLYQSVHGVTLMIQYITSTDSYYYTEVLSNKLVAKVLPDPGHPGKYLYFIGDEMTVKAEKPHNGGLPDNYDFTD